MWLCLGFSGLDLSFNWLWLCWGFPRSCWAVIVHTHMLLLVLVLPLQGCGCAQASLGLVLPLLVCGYAHASFSLGLVFAGLLLCTGFSQSWSCFFLDVVLLRLPLVLVVTLLGCDCAQTYPSFVLHLLGSDCAQASPGLGLAFAGLWLCNFTKNKVLTWEILRVRFPLEYNVTQRQAVKIS